MKKRITDVKQNIIYLTFARPLKQIVIMTIMATSLLVFAAASGPVFADDDDQKTAREALEAGKIRPLMELLEKVESAYQGKILEVELESEDSDSNDDEEMLVYEIKLLTPQGNVVKLSFDASNLELLVVDGHDSDKALKQDGELD